MKKIWSMVLIGVCFAMASCSDDDNTQIPDELLGEWVLQNMEIGVLNTTDPNVEEMAEEIFTELSKEFYFGETIEFYDNGTIIFQDEEMNFFIRNNILTLIDDSDYRMSFSYSIQNNRLILTLDMRKIIVEEMAGEIEKETLDYIKKTMKEFTIDFIYKR